ncbi:reverse transcriptase domain-containing protein [Tanacetum coccineum]
MQEAEEAFQKMKEYIETLPTVTAPIKGETLVMYLVVSKESISAFLLTERGKKQIPIYFISQALKGAEMEYPEREKLTLALVYAARRLRRGAIPLRNRSWMRYRQRKIKRIRPKIQGMRSWDPEDTWKLYTNGASSSDGFGAGLILVNPEGKEYTCALRFEFETTNNGASSSDGFGLRITEEMKIEDLDIFVDSQLVENQVKGLFEARQTIIKQYLEKTREMLKSFKSYFMEHVWQD